MNLDFKKSFARDLKKRKTDQPLLDRVRQIIREVEEAPDIHSIRNLKKLKAQGSHYRIRMGDYRLGLVIEENTVCFVRFLHRGEIYKYFP
ncbi:type II toxin-antitoxin system RelE/ParE family toxin [uncultured Desulfobacter sp.]|uniref:type II toxin-antitoxin system RelE family toxin n=1 Tax=uncultured Desulfobacter sp. TaxID=240139 RepID=UPI0029F55BBE|nr:type II toxin-antitoxin system RelE/ParE family toxin [uncultured Desulfobacter sp.]